ncbi:alpha/beta hydrolase [Streptomyces sp. NPDC017988]|uniref:alpha/beta hydrolase n=1 Tax=Streptomyces sp. NPDC017988 TaxID=3365025 RepID=UPI0037B0D4BE
MAWSFTLTVAGGERHGVLYAPDSSPCADKAVTVYLTTGRLPAKDLTCQPPAGRKWQRGGAQAEWLRERGAPRATRRRCRSAVRRGGGATGAARTSRCRTTA